MGWEARTAFVSVAVNARLCIFKTPQSDGQPAPVLVGDVPIDIQLSNENWIKGLIWNANPQTAILEMPDGVKYQISPRRSGEFESGISLNGMYSQDWIVRSQII